MAIWCIGPHKKGRRAGGAAYLQPSGLGRPSSYERVAFNHSSGGPRGAARGGPIYIQGQRLTLHLLPRAFMGRPLFERKSTSSKFPPASWQPQGGPWVGRIRISWG